MFTRNRTEPRSEPPKTAMGVPRADLPPVIPLAHELTANAPPPPIPAAAPQQHAEPIVQAHGAPAQSATAQGGDAPMAASSVIGEDLTIEGQSITIRCRGALHINGSIQAELHSRQLVVGHSGTVAGTIAADSVDVFGRVSGAIRGSRVVLHSSAEVEGDIHARSLSVEDGASFEGRSRKVTDAAAIAPQLDGAVVQATGSEPVPLPRSA